MNYEKTDRLISIKQLSATGACADRLQALAYKAMKSGFLYDQQLRLKDIIQWTSDSDKEWLVSNGFIKKKEEKTYKVGDVVSIGLLRGNWLICRGESEGENDVFFVQIHRDYGYYGVGYANARRHTVKDSNCFTNDEVNNLIDEKTGA